MELRIFIERALEIWRERLLKTVEDVSQEELLWVPGPDSNHIGFILWHVFRVEDNYIQKFILKRDELWKRESLHLKFNLPERDTGFGYTAEQVEALRLPNLKDLVDYYNAVRNETLDYLRGLKPEDFEHFPRPDRRPDFNVARVFHQILIHEGEHIGQVAYLLGVQRGQGLYGFSRDDIFYRG